MPSLNKKMSNTRHGGPGLARLLLASAVAMALAAPQTSLPARATDMEAPITDASAQEAGGQFVRMGLNKSIVVKLPAEARDVIVGNPEIVDAVVRRKNMAYVFARQIGQSNIFFFDAKGEQILALDIEVALDPLALKKLINRTFPGNRVKVDTVNQDVVLGGHARNVLEAKMIMELAIKFAKGGGGSGGTSDEVNVIDTMQVAGEDQVMLKVKIVEMRRDVLKQLGIDLQAAITAGENVFNLSNLNPLDFAGVAGSGLQASDNVGKFRFNNILRALEQDGLSRTLAEPNLTALNGKKAKFNAGGEIPYQVCDSGTSDCSTEFKEFGVGLEFSPLVLPNNRIAISLETRVSDISGLVVNGVPALDSRSTSTTVELPSGGSMMIAGLIRENTRQNLDGFPGLKKLPVLGSLFRSRDFQANETELVVIVTPYLVNPVATGDLTTPDKNFNPATERQTLFFGQLHKNYGPNGKTAKGNYNGNVGFIVE